MMPFSCRVLVFSLWQTLEEIKQHSLTEHLNIAVIKTKGKTAAPVSCHCDFTPSWRRWLRQACNLWYVILRDVKHDDDWNICFNKFPNQAQYFSTLLPEDILGSLTGPIHMEMMRKRLYCFHQCIRIKDSKSPL